MNDESLVILESCKSNAENCLEQGKINSHITIPARVFLELMDERQKVCQDIYRIIHTADTIKTRLEA